MEKKYESIQIHRYEAKIQNNTITIDKKHAFMNRGNNCYFIPNNEPRGYLVTYAKWHMRLYDTQLGTVIGKNRYFVYLTENDDARALTIFMDYFREKIKEHEAAIQTFNKYITSLEENKQAGHLPAEGSPK